MNLLAECIKSSTMYRLVSETFSWIIPLSGCMLDDLTLYEWSQGDVEEEELQS